MVSVSIGRQVYGVFKTRSEAVAHCAKRGMRFPPRIETVEKPRKASQPVRAYRSYVERFGVPITFHLE